MIRTFFKFAQICFIFSFAWLVLCGNRAVSHVNKNNKLEKKHAENQLNSSFVYCHELQTERLDTVARTIFWRKLMNTSKDTFVFYASPEKVVLCSI